MFLFDVGFQLSYLAVLAILTIHPKLSKYYIPGNKVTSVVWNTATVTLAAQIGLAPLSIYYFHQFPGLFFITNILVLPLLGGILSMGILVIVLACFSILPESLAHFYGNTIGLLNNFIAWVARQDAFLFQEISFSGALLLASYFFLFSSLILWGKWHIKHITRWLCSCVLILLVLLAAHWNNTPSQLIVIHKSKQTMLAIKQGQSSILLMTDSVSKTMSNIISDYKTGSNSRNISEEEIPHIFKYKDTIVLILDKLGVFPKGLKNPVVLLTQSTQVHLERFIDSVQPIGIIADGSNYKSYVARWKETCRQKKIPFHSTYEKGAYIWE